MMRWPTCSWRLGFLLVVALRLSVPGPLTAQPAPAALNDLDAALEQSRALLKNGDYDHALDLLRTAIDQARHRTDRLREAYLLMIKTYVFMGNARRFEVQGREAALLAYKEAKARVLECLGIRELRHTLPEPRSEYPDEMVRMFAEARAEIFGAFRVVALAPPGASVLLDGDTLRTQADGTLGDVDLAVGPHNVLIQLQGYETRTDAITIAPASTLERDYRLAKNRSRLWHASFGAAGLGAVAGLAFAIGGKGATLGGGDFGTARSLDIGQSVRAAGMGGAGGSVSWGNLDDWANPALLGIQQGIRYQWGRTQLVPGLADNVWLTTHRLAAGSGGIGIGLPGVFGDHGTTLLTYGNSEGSDENGNRFVVESYEGSSSWGVGMNMTTGFESLMRLAGYSPPLMSERFDAAIGFNRKHVKMQLGAPGYYGQADAVDYGLLGRATVADNLARLRPGLPYRIDVGYGFSVLGADGAAVRFPAENQSSPVTTTFRNGFAVRVMSGVPRGGPWRWLPAESLTPLISVGITSDFEHIGSIRVQRYGVELTLANLLSLRTGSVQDKAGEIHGATYGVGLGYRYGSVAGINYDFALVPQAANSGLKDVRRHGVAVFFDPLRFARAVR